MAQGTHKALLEGADISTEIEHQNGSRTTVSVYTESPLRVIRQRLRLRSHNRYRKDHEDAKYVGSGLWSYRRDGDRLHITIDTGCWHEHDCCGCICGLTYTVAAVDGVTVVIGRSCINI